MNFIKSLFQNQKFVWPFTILDRYVIGECWLPFSSGCGIVTGVWLGVDQVSEAFSLLSKANIDFTIALSIILLNIPKILLVTIPVGVLWATFLVFNRLSSDSEIIAMRASGISLIRVAVPAFLFGLMMTGVCFFISEVVVTWTEPAAKKIEFAATYGIPFVPSMDDFVYLERSGGRRVGQGALKRIFYVKVCDPIKKELHNVLILDLSNEKLKSVYVAANGKWNTQRGGWDLLNGTSYNVSADDPTAASHVTRFDRILIPSGKSTDDLIKKLEEVKSLNLIQLYSLLKQQEKLGIETDTPRKNLMLFHKKIAYPFSCFVITLIGAPLGIMGRRSRTNWGYLQMGILIFAYYAMQSAIYPYGESGRLGPIVASWLPNILLGAIGAVILWRRSRFVS